MNTLYTLYGCSEVVPNNLCDDCNTPEPGRLRSVAFIRAGFDFSDPEDATEWLGALAAGNAVVVPSVRGSYDGGSTVEVEGFGWRRKVNVGKEFSAVYTDPGFALNRDFYNYMLTSGSWRFAFTTENTMSITRVPVSVSPKSKIDDSFSSSVNWEVEVQWADTELPELYTIPVGVFVCEGYGVIPPAPTQGGVFSNIFSRVFD